MADNDVVAFSSQLTVCRLHVSDLDVFHDGGLQVVLSSGSFHAANSDSVPALVVCRTGQNQCHGIGGSAFFGGVGAAACEASDAQDNNQGQRNDFLHFGFSFRFLFTFLLNQIVESSTGITKYTGTYGFTLHTQGVLVDTQKHVVLKDDLTVDHG